MESERANEHCALSPSIVSGLVKMSSRVNQVNQATSYSICWFVIRKAIEWSKRKKWKSSRERERHSGNSKSCCCYFHFQFHREWKREKERERMKQRSFTGMARGVSVFGEELPNAPKRDKF